MKQIEARTLPTEVYLSFVASLFGNRGTLLTGVVIHAFSCLLTFVHAGANFYLGLLAGFLLVFSYRFYWFRRFDKVNEAALTHAEIEGWEIRYVYGAASAALLLGLGSGYAIAVLQDMFATFLWISVTMASMVSIVGRNFGSRLAVTSQTLGCCVPIFIACLINGDIYLIIMSLFLIPFSLTTGSMATGLRGFLYENVRTWRDAALLPDRFDMALTTMGHGLVMLDGQGKTQVANRRARELLGLDAGRHLKDDVFASVLRESAGVPADVNVHDIDRLAGGSLSRALIKVGDGRHLEFSASNRSDGGVVLIFEDVSDRVAAEEKILHMVQFDALTGLPNRGHFAMLGAAMLQGKGESLAALAVFDVDGFKHVNDMRGHVIGDHLLAAIAAKFSAWQDEDLLVGRLTGDEFVLLIAAGTDDSGLESRIGAIHAAIQGDYHVEGLRLIVSVNSGCVVLPSRDFDMESWQIKADLALNQAKRTGHGTLTVFQPEMDARYIDEQKLRADLQHALASDSLHVEYQPMYRPDGSVIECSEALVRWTHPERGSVAPNIFIPLAEGMGLVTRITHFVVDRACRDCASWPAPVGVSINLSIEDLRTDEIVDYVAAALQRSQLDPSRLHLEVTESCFMDEPVAVSAILNRFRDAGVTVAVDDFGTGFSSLSYLDTLPLDVVKIDRTFIHNIGQDDRKLKLLRGVVHLARELGLRIVLEGVETREQLMLVNRHRFADLIQGYVFSTPVGADRIGELAREALANGKSAGSGRTRKANTPIGTAAP